MSKDASIKTLAEMFDWGWSDVEHLMEMFNALDNMDISYGEIRESIEETESKLIDINSWIYFGYDRINREIFDAVIERLNNTEEVDEDLLRLAQDKIENFEPFINCLDSHFNNLLDNQYFCDITLEDDFISLVIKELNEELRGS